MLCFQDDNKINRHKKISAKITSSSFRSGSDTKTGAFTAV